LGSVLRRLPVGIARTAFHVVDLLAIELEGDSNLDKRFDLALAGEDAIGWSFDRLEVAGANRRKADATRPVDVDHAASGEIALQGARRFLFEVCPRRFGNRGKLAMKIIHNGSLL
jgi:hypothetical protein